MDEKIDTLLQSPYWVIDILPEQVPKNSPGQYFDIENYFLEGERFSEIKQKHINVILKLNCYRKISIAGENTFNPAPQYISDEMRKRYLYIMLDEAMILSEPDDTHLTVFNPDDKLLGLIKAIAAGEGLFVCRPSVSE